jgi:mono/diheme cytochrome c family protein
MTLKALLDLRAFVIPAGLVCGMSAGLAVNATGPGGERDQEPRGQESTVSPQRTVWDGVYTEEQAARGRMQYVQACASCHAGDLRGDSTAPSLIEESFSFQWGDTTVGELFERIRTLMPSNRPSSLSSQSYRDIVAFILQSNKFPPGEKELASEADALRQIAIVMKRPDG